MNKTVKRIFSLLMAIITAGSLTFSAFAEKRVSKSPDEEYYEYLLKATRGELTNGQILKFLISDGDINVDIFHTDEVELFRSKTALVSFDCDLSDVPEEYLKSGDYKIYAYFEFYTSASTHYVCEVCLNERRAYAAEELLSAAGVEDSAEITAIRVYQRNFVSKEIKEQLYNEDYIALRCFRRIDNAFVINSNNKGWNTVNLSTKYYVKKDGTLATKSCKIGGVRYKFTADGICRGRYTGWTKSANGRRYWKNGELVTEKYLRTKSGRRYYADKDGYVTEVLAEANPGTNQNAKPRDIVINGRRISPFISGYYLFTEIDGEYKCYRGSDYTSVTNLFPSSLITVDFVNEILGFYEPAGTAVFAENVRNEFETTMEEFDGAKVYITDDAFEPCTDENADEVCILVVTSEPYRKIEGMDFYFCTYMTHDDVKNSYKINNA